MKKVYTLIAACLVSAASFAGITSASFEGNATSLQGDGNLHSYAGITKEQGQTIAVVAELDLADVDWVSLELKIQNTSTYAETVVVTQALTVAASIDETITIPADATLSADLEEGTKYVVKLVTGNTDDTILSAAVADNVMVTEAGLEAATVTFAWNGTAPVAAESETPLGTWVAGSSISIDYVFNEHFGISADKVDARLTVITSATYAQVSEVSIQEEAVTVSPASIDYLIPESTIGSSSLPAGEEYLLQARVHFGGASIYANAKVTIDELVSVNTAKATSVKVYPNPVAAGADFTVEAPEGSSVEVFTYAGVKVSADNLTTGLYKVVITTGETKVVETLVVK